MCAVWISRVCIYKVGSRVLQCIWYQCIRNGGTVSFRLVMQKQATWTLLRSRSDSPDVPEDAGKRSSAQASLPTPDPVAPAENAQQRGRHRARAQPAQQTPAQAAGGGGACSWRMPLPVPAAPVVQQPTGQPSVQRADSFEQSLEKGAAHAAEEDDDGVEDGERPASEEAAATNHEDAAEDLEDSDVDVDPAMAAADARFRAQGFLSEDDDGSEERPPPKRRQRSAQQGRGAANRRPAVPDPLSPVQAPPPKGRGSSAVQRERGTAALVGAARGQSRSGGSGESPSETGSQRRGAASRGGGSVPVRSENVAPSSQATGGRVRPAVAKKPAVLGKRNSTRARNNSPLIALSSGRD